MLVFDRPLAFALLLLLPLAIWARYFYAGRGGQVAMAFSSWQGQYYKGIGSIVRVFYHTCNVLYWLGAVSLICALAGPIILEKKQVYLSQGMEIMFVVDISPTMAAYDTPGKSRLMYAKETIKDFLGQRKNDDIGLVAFASDAALYCPPTRDYQTLQLGLDRLKILDLGEGTAIGLGLTVAAAHIKDSLINDKIIVLLSDGDNNYGEISPETAAAMVSASGIRVYSIGIGSEQPVEIEFENLKENKVYRGTVRGTLNQPLLEKISKLSGGAYFYARTGAVLADALKTIDDLERPELRVRQDLIRHSWQGLFLAIALGALLGDLAIRRLVLREII